jgi:hypothetical protein
MILGAEMEITAGKVVEVARTPPTNWQTVNNPAGE